MNSTGFLGLVFTISALVLAAGIGVVEIVAHSGASVPNNTLQACQNYVSACLHPMSPEQYANYVQACMAGGWNTTTAGC